MWLYRSVLTLECVVLVVLVIFGRLVSAVRVLSMRVTLCI